MENPFATDTSARLTEDDVYDRVLGYRDVKTTASLRQFGEVLLAANRERTRTLETKATAITGYALGVLVFLISREPVQSIVIASWPPNLVKVAALFAAAAVVAMALSLAVVAMALSLAVRNHRWLSDDQWFQNEDELLNNAEMLARGHILAIHAANRALTISNDWKAHLVTAGQIALAISGGCLGLWLVLR